MSTFPGPTAGPGWQGGGNGGIAPVPGRGPRVPDAGSPATAKLAWVLAVICLAAVVFLQQGGVGARGKTAHGAPQPAGEAVKIEPPSKGDTSLVFSRLLVRLGSAMRKMKPGASPDPEIERVLAQYGEQIGETASGHVGELRAATVAGEMGGGEAATKALDALMSAMAKDEKPEATNALVLDDAKLLRSLYAHERDLTDEEKARLRARHGFFGELAGEFGSGPSPARVQWGEQGATALVVLLLVGGCIIVGLLAGLGLGITALVLGVQGKLLPRLERPAPGGSVGIEMLVALMLGFVIFKGVLVLVHQAAGDEVANLTALIGQWALVPVIFWPMARGASFAEWKRMIGWSAPRGVIREIGAGVLGYFACVPIYVGAVLLSVLLMAIQSIIVQALGMKEPAAPQNPIIDMVLASSPLQLVLFVVLATMWAPIVEESVFRGGMFRHMTARWHWLLAALMSAVTFGLMHGYAILLLAPVMSLGFSFAMIRWWRGSLVPCVTAHFLHNSLVTCAMVIVLKVIAA